VAPGLVLTCAHVVHDTRDDAASVSVHYGNQEYSVRRIEYLFVDPYVDLALLRVNLNEHPCAFLDASVNPLDPLYTYGYTKKGRGSAALTVGQSTTIDYEGQTRTDDGRWLLRFKGGQILPGYSGSPLLNTVTGTVCGVVKSTRDRATDMGGGAVPASVVLSQIPELTGLQSAFHGRDRRWAQARSAHEALRARAESVAEAQAYDAILYRQAGNIQSPEILYGRHDLIVEVNALLDEAKHVLLTGYGGTGKTALAATISDSRIEDGKGPVVWLRAGNSDAERLFEAIAVPLGAKDSLDSLQGNAKMNAVQSLLAESGVGLLVLDDLRSGNALSQVRAALRGSGLPVLVTSRQGFANVDEAVTVRDLLPDEALELLAHYAQNPTFTDHDYKADADLPRLCEALGCHALGLVIAGGWLRKRERKPGDLMRRIDQRRLAPSTIEMPASFAQEGREMVKVVLDETFYALNSATRDMFKAFGALFEPRATVELLAVIAGLEDGLDVEDALDELVSWNFVLKDAGSYTMHDMVHSYAETVLFEGDAPDRRSTVAAVQRYVIDRAQDFENLQLDQPNILRAAEAADGQTLVSIMSVLTVGGYPDVRPPSYLDTRGHTVGFLARLDEAIEIAEQIEAEENELRHYLLSKRGNVHFDRGKLEEAFTTYQAALELAPSPHRQGLLLGVIGKVCSRLERYAEADAYFQKGYELARANGDDLALCFVLEQKSYAAGLREDYETAHQSAVETVAVSRRLGDPVRLAMALVNLGSAKFMLAMCEVLDSHLEAYELVQETDRRELVANVLYALGMDYHALREHYGKAQEYLSKARKLYQEIGSTEREDEITVFMRRFGYMEPLSDLAIRDG
jgi:tetratricopeptide (TPR) repeat protein